MSRTNIFLWIILFLSITNPIWCKDTLPDFYPSSFNHEGILQEIKESGDVLIINATAYKIGNNAMVHALNNNFASKKVLRKGMDVGFHFSNDASKRKVISEIWILPEGYAEVD